jgi:hypothetical protein
MTSKRSGAGKSKSRRTNAQRATSGGLGWILTTVIGVLVLGGLVALLLLRGGDDGDAGATPPQAGDHWHAAFGINVCGEFLPDIPAFEARAGTNLRAGIHSHGDGLIHIHPLATDETGDNATVGRYLDYAGGSISADSITVPDGPTLSNGEPCPDGNVGKVRWSVNGEERDGNPADYKPRNGDVVVVGFVPDGQDLGTPASAARVATPSDV